MTTAESIVNHILELDGHAIKERAVGIVELYLERELREVRAALTEALDWAKRFDGRHDRSGGYSSELLPMFTRIGERLREDRLSELAKLGEQP